MNFLCPNHRQRFADLPPGERKGLWLSWMKQACACSEENHWQGVLSFSGSAFDLACLRGSHKEESSMGIELTLSAILVSRVLFDFADRAGSEAVILRALEHLLANEHDASRADCQEIEECIAVLMDTSRQADFFADYLNWSTLAFARRDRSSVCKTLH